MMPGAAEAIHRGHRPDICFHRRARPRPQVQSTRLLLSVLQRVHRMPWSGAWAVTLATPFLMMWPMRRPRHWITNTVKSPASTFGRYPATSMSAGYTGCTAI